MNMITFKQFCESKGPARLPWDSNPKIGWWESGRSLRLYHGTNLDHLDSIAATGLDRLDARTGMISFALEPFTARAFAVMGGEARFLAAGSKALVVPENKRVVLVFDVPRGFIQNHRDPDLRGNDPEHKQRLTNRELYDEWNSTDQQYYQLCELRLSSKIPPKYLVGYMLKG